jgi:hypothetical protein
MQQPSIKGAAFCGTVARLPACLESGQVTEEQVELRLEAQDLRFLDEKIEPTLWYPIASAGRIDELVGDLSGQECEEYFVACGLEEVDTVFSKGVFETFIEGARKMEGRIGETLTRLASLGFNFGRWTYEEVSYGEFSIQAREVAPLPESIRYTVQGLILGLARKLRDIDVEISSQRLRPDVVTYRSLPG